MKKNQPVTFEVSIEEYNNHTWQGTVRMNGQTIPFQSDLDLLLLINRLVNEPCEKLSIKLLHKDRRSHRWNSMQAAPAVPHIRIIRKAPRATSSLLGNA